MKLSDLNLRSIGDTIQLSGAIYSGEGKHFVCFFPDEGGVESVTETLVMDREDWVKFIAQTDLMETEIIQHHEDGTCVKAIVRKSQRQIDASISWKVFRRDGFSCRYCGIQTAPLTVDHVVLWEDGGPSTDDNLISACKKCNRTRGSMPYEVWLSSPYYMKRAEGVTQSVRDQNAAVVGTLSSIKRVIHKRSR